MEHRRGRHGGNHLPVCSETPDTATIVITDLDNPGAALAAPTTQPKLKCTLFYAREGQGMDHRRGCRGGNHRQRALKVSGHDGHRLQRPGEPRSRGGSRQSPATLAECNFRRSSSTERRVTLSSYTLMLRND